MRRSSNIAEKNRIGSCAPNHGSTLPSSFCDPQSRVQKERKVDLKGNVTGVQAPISTTLPLTPSCINDFLGSKSDHSFDEIGRKFDSTRKYSINRFKFSNEVHDEIIKHMNKADSDMHIQEITKVGKDQFLTYQILIKTNGSIYFIKPKDKKCFLLNKNSVSEMVAPNKTFNSNGDEINTAKFAYVELESGSIYSNQSSTSRSCGYTNESRNCFSSTETDHYNMCLHNEISASDSELTNTTESQSQWSDNQWKTKNSDLSKVMIKSSKTTTHQLQKMSVGTCYRPYHFCNIVFYSTISVRNSDLALQNKYFAFVKNKIKDKLHNFPNHANAKKRDINDQAPEKKDTALTAEYVNHLWEKNKRDEGKKMFNLEPEFYSQMFSLKLSAKSMVELGLDPKNNSGQSSRLSSLLSRPSKHDSLLTSILDLKIRDIMSLVWNSSSKSKVSGVNVSQDEPEKTKKGERRDLQKSKKEKDKLGKMMSQQETHHSKLSPVSMKKVEGDKQFNELSPMDQGKYLIRMKQKSAFAGCEMKRSDGQDPKVPSSSIETKAMAESLDLSVPKSIQKRLHSETLNESNSAFTDSGGDEKKAGEEVCADDSLNNLVMIHEKIENGNNNCVLALTSNDDHQPPIVTEIEEEERAKKHDSLNIVQQSNMELHTLISMMELTPSHNDKSDVSNYNSNAEIAPNPKCSKSNFKSQATLSISSNSCIDMQKSLKANSTIGWSFHAEPIYSNVYRKQQIAQDSMMEKVIPEDSILSISTRSNDSLNNPASPTYASRTTCVQNPNNPCKDCCSQSEDAMLRNCCNSSVLAMVPSKRALHSETCRIDSSKHKFRRWTKTSRIEPPCDRKGRTVSRQTVTPKSRSTRSRFNANEVLNVRALAESGSEKNNQSKSLKRIRIRKSNVDTGNKLNEKASKGFRRVLTVPSFISEKSYRSTRSRKSRMNESKCKFGSACRFAHQFSVHSNLFEYSDDSWTKSSSGKSRFLKETEFLDVTCDVNAVVTASYSERSFPHLRGDPSYASVVKKQKLHSRKRIAKHKCQDSCGVAQSNCEGDSGHQTSKKPIPKKSNKSKKKMTKKEEDEKGVIVSWLKTGNVLSNKKLTKKLMLNGRKIDIEKLYDEFVFDRRVQKSGTISDSSLSSYKTVHSQSLFDDLTDCKLDRESESATETNKKSALHTFIGPSAIDGMMNIINLFYARQKLDECSSFQD